MSKIKFMLSAVLLFVVQAVMAQGQRISGTITDSFGPVMMANVVERDDNNRIVTAAVTDVNGNFSMVVKNPKNKLAVSYVGYKTVVLPIGSRTKFNVSMGSSQTTIKEVTVTSKRRSNSGGLNIPKREVSVAQQTMDMSEVEGLAFTSADEALQGKIAGLDIVAGSGNLGSGTQMRLRGVTSINGNKNPLIVVDNQIFDAPDFDAENATDEDYASLLSVNVDDIASINVLKDASSTAVWGTRGANGVIEIKTKRGARGKTRVAFSYKFTGSWQPDGYKLLNGDDYTMLLKEELYNPKQDPDATRLINEINYNKSWADYENWNNNTDWVDAVTQFGQSHSYNVNLSGGGQKANFRISAGYDHQTGTIIKQSLNRFTTRLSLDYFVSDRIKFISTFAFTYTNNNKNYADLLGKAQTLAPNMSIYRQDANGNDTNEYFIMNATSGVRNPSSAELADVYAIGNPVAIANLAWSKDNTYRINPDFAIQYDLLGTGEGKHRLTYTGDVYFDIYSRSTPSYAPAEIIKTTWANAINPNKDVAYNKAYNLESNNVGFRVKNELRYVPYFKNEDWSAQMLFRYEFYTANGNRQSETDRLIPTGIEIPTTGSFMREASSSTSESRTQSWIYNGHVAYKSKYTLQFSVRADGDSKFGPKNKWAYFPAVSGRWNIIDESFMKPIRKVVSMLAFRPGWGIVGNAPSDESLFYEAYHSGGIYGPGSGQSTNYVSRLKLDDLKWERTTSYNIGFNLGLFDDKIEAELDYYHKTTKDLLMKNVKIPSSTGYSSLAWANVGEMTNEGWELNISFNNIIKAGKFSMSAYANVSQNYNEISKMEDNVLESVNATWSASNGTYLNRVQIGNPLGSIYGYRYKGVYQYTYEGMYKEYDRFCKNGNEGANFESWLNNEFLGKGRTAPIVTDANGKAVLNGDGTPKKMVFDYSGVNYTFKGGDAIYEDINHDGQINQLDVVYLGNSLPKVNGGFGFTFKYDRFTLRTSFNCRFGNKVVNMARMNLESMHSTMNQTSSVNYRWRKDGDGTKGNVLPRALYGKSTAYNWLGSDRYVEDASFVRFQYVQLTYDLPKTLCKHFGLNTFKIYASANNLYCWTKYSGTDPEHSQSGWNYASDNAKTPRSKSFTVGLNVAF